MCINEEALLRARGSVALGDSGDPRTCLRMSHPKREHTGVFTPILVHPWLRVLRLLWGERGLCFLDRVRACGGTGSLGYGTGGPQALLGTPSTPDAGERACLVPNSSPGQGPSAVSGGQACEPTDDCEGRAGLTGRVRDQTLKYRKDCGGCRDQGQQMGPTSPSAPDSLSHYASPEPPRACLVGAPPAPALL